ncbi:HEPN family nuclease [Photobacterium angustum]|uniref:HEPN family nuclease n=1 Tax=Photobacterium angustum TaxID=661 RepID=UPI0005E57536|nr:HEPN family nuclease [Photobacterium angustum]KJF94105.1 hypothetical protein UB39_11760 [Photobacterium angustum]PSW78837.1 hypothetical protein CTN03_18165 [Photobacterium angustum]
MSFTDFENEKDAIDLVTGSMFSVDFLKGISDLIFSEHADQVTVSEFYSEWLRNSGSEEHQIPFSLGIITSYLYTGILLTKERWFDLIPDDSSQEKLTEWGLSSIYYTSAKNSSPSIRYVIKRMRNALGHGNIKIDVPKESFNKSEVMQKVYFEFYDENMRDSSDTFHARANLESLTSIVRNIQGIAHKDIRERVQAQAEQVITSDS